MQLFFKKFLGYVLLFFYVFYLGCSSYFSKSEFLDTPPELLAQNSRMILLSGADKKLKIAARLTHLNSLDSSIYNGREYFFLEIFNDDEYTVMPDSMQLSMFGRKPLWIRPIDTRELDDLLTLQNNLSSGYLIAFRYPSVFEKKSMKVQLSIESFEPAVFDFSYIILDSKL
ncbi:hypothetical protein NHP164001_09480 [Helicobacter trogontum]|uniref:Lipoprotein n=1 Tax=Helicobacter trogontum TaxID=50960 RepID=A0ABQ0D3M9_9HELI